MNLTCIIFSGLPGTGKTTLARLLSRELHLPLIQLDAVVGIIPPHMLRHAEPFWDDMMQIVMQLAAAQLANGLSVVVDAVFMGPDRAQMQELARRHGARWRPLHTFVSDEAVWQQRVEQRCAEQPEDEPATWEGIGQQRLAFAPWLSEQALFLDTLAPPALNVARIHAYLREDGRT